MYIFIVPSFDDANTDSDATDGDSAGADTTDGTYVRSIAVDTSCGLM